jgi:hypothetical protein
MHLSRLRLLVLASSSCAAFAMACGGISDPTKGGSNEPVATVSGALTGTSVPANARVALVWRTATSSTENGGYAVGDDVAVVNGKFTMNLAVPAAAYFTEIDGTGEFSSSSSSGSTPPSVPTDPAPTPEPAPAPGTSSSGGGKLPAFGARLTPRDNVSGGFVTSPLSGAVAGFVVYVDANGNGKLDLSGAYASSTDTILGGNKELVLTYLKDGGALDYEKLRDTSGILPTAGFNLAWTVGKRWVPLNVVQLKLDPSQGLPGPVCSLSGAYSGGSGGTDGFDPVANPPSPLPDPDGSGGSSSGSSGTSTDAGTPGSGSSSGSSGSSSGSSGGSYPSPTDPNLHCSPDGRSFSYSEPVNCPPAPPAPTGLCANGWGDIAVGCAPSTGWGTGLASGEPVPPNWPCPVAVDQDGGPAPDAGK